MRMVARDRRAESVEAFAAANACSDPVRRGEHLYNFSASRQPFALVVCSVHLRAYLPQLCCEIGNRRFQFFNLAERLQSETSLV